MKIPTQIYKIVIFNERSEVLPFIHIQINVTSLTHLKEN